MKRIVIALGLVALLSGCVVADPYYARPAPVVVRPVPVYIAPPPPLRCYWTQQWNNYYRSYQNVRVCR